MDIKQSIAEFIACREIIVPAAGQIWIDPEGRRRRLGICCDTEAAYPSTKNTEEDYGDHIAWFNLKHKGWRFESYDPD